MPRQPDNGDPVFSDDDSEFSDDDPEFSDDDPGYSDDDPGYSDDDPGYSDDDIDNHHTSFDDGYRRDSHRQPRPLAANARRCHQSPRESFEQARVRRVLPGRGPNESLRQIDSDIDSDSEPDNDGEPQSSRRRAAQEPHGTERLMPRGDEHRPRAMNANNRATLNRPRPGIDVDDEELQRVFQASLTEQNAREQRIRKREEAIAAREAADEAVAIAESARLAANPTAAQRREADADAELERVLRESAAEAEEKEARDKAALASLHARFGEASARQLRSSPSHDSAPSASSQRDRANSAPQSPAAPSNGRPERSNPAPREPAASATERLMSADNNFVRRGVTLARQASMRATPAAQRQQPRRAASDRLVETLLGESESPPSPAAATQPDPPSAAGNRPRAPPNPAPRRNAERQPEPPSSSAAATQPDPPRAAANRPRPPPNPAPRRNAGRQPERPSSSAAATQPDPPRAAANRPRAPPNPTSRRQPHALAPQSNPRSRRNSEPAHHAERQPEPPSTLVAAPQPNPPRAAANSPRARPNLTRERANPPRQQPGSSRPQPHDPAPQRPRNSERTRNHGVLDPSIRQALNNSERLARLERGRGGRNVREEEQMRLAIQNSLGDAPLPADPIEGLIDAPPAYDEIGQDKKLDPLRYTTTNDKGNEPGHKRRITPEILAAMKKVLLQQQKFDAKAKAAGDDLPPANNAMAKKQKRAPVVGNSPAAGSPASAADPVDSLENLLGTRLPPPRLARDAPANRAAASSDDDAFVSRVPGLASNARSRIPQSRPWDNAFSRLPGDRRPSRRS